MVNTTMENHHFSWENPPAAAIDLVKSDVAFTTADPRTCANATCCPIRCPSRSNGRWNVRPPLDMFVGLDSPQ